MSSVQCIQGTQCIQSCGVPDGLSLSLSLSHRVTYTALPPLTCVHVVIMIIALLSI